MGHSEGRITAAEQGIPWLSSSIGAIESGVTCLEEEVTAISASTVMDHNPPPHHMLFPVNT